MHTWTQSLIAPGAMVIPKHNKYDQLVEHNYTTTEQEVLTMVCALHLYIRALNLLGYRFTLFVHHMTLLHSMNNSQVSKHIAGWLLLFLSYAFKAICKLGMFSFNCRCLISFIRYSRRKHAWILSCEYMK